MDTGTAISAASSCLAALHVDLAMLEGECHVVGEVSGYWNGITRGEKPKGKTFVPIYDVIWEPLEEKMVFKNGAFVELILPSKTILQLSLNNGKYIHRKQVEFTNLDYLFPGIASIVTNTHGKQNGVTNWIAPSLNLEMAGKTNPAY